MNGERLSRLPQVLFEIGKAIGSDEDLATLLTHISELLTDLLGADACSVMLLDVDERRLLTKAAHGLGEGRVGKLSFAIGEGVAGWVVERGQPALIDDVADDDRFVYLGGDNTSIKSLACVPLLVRGKSVGVLTVTAGQPAAFNGTDVEVLEFVAKTIGLDVENIRLQRLSVTDPLTGAFNREFLGRRLPIEMDAAAQRGAALSVAMVDVDHFKPVNDRYGHDVGDQVLAEVAGRLRSAIRKEDLLVRYGGEEFLIVLPAADAATARDIGERMRARMQADPVLAGGATIEVRISVGVAEKRADEERPADLVRRADTALYQAKDRGRNRVEVAA